MYVDLVERIREFLKKDEIIYNNLVVSAYDLENAIEKLVGNYRRIIFDKNIHNKFKISQQPNKIFSITKKKESISITNAFYTINNGLINLELELPFCSDDRNKICRLIIYKHINVDEFFYYDYNLKIIDEDFFHNFININKEVLDNDFSILEQFYKNFLDYMEENYRLTDFNPNCSYKDSLFSVKFSVNRGTVLEFYDNFDNFISRQNWLQKEDIKDIINNNYPNILKRIEIPISSLPDFFRHILDLSNSDIKKEEKPIKGSIKVKTRKTRD